MCKVEQEVESQNSAHFLTNVARCLDLAEESPEFGSGIVGGLASEITQAVHTAETADSGYTHPDRYLARPPLLLQTRRKHIVPGETKPSFDQMFSLKWVPSPEVSRKVDAFFDQMETKGRLPDEEEKALRSLLSGL